MGARRIFSTGVQTQSMNEGHICLVSTCGTPTYAVVFPSIEKSSTASPCQTLCMDSVLQNPEKQNPGGASAPPCTCLRAPLRQTINVHVKHTTDIYWQTPLTRLFISSHKLTKAKKMADLSKPRLSKTFDESDLV